jgi:hypothetical protein
VGGIGSGPLFNGLAGGAISLAGGAGAAATSGNGGNGGNITFTAGAGGAELMGGGSEGNGGDVTINGGSGLTYGDIILANAGGYVGIGTTAPSYALDVKASGTGVIARFNSSNSTGCTLADGGTITCSSDATLKKNVLGISYGLADVMQLNPVSYNWKFQDDATIKTLGFLAQDVETILPGLVSTDSNGLKSLNTIGMIPVLAKAIQEQQLQIDEIKLSSSSASISNAEWSALTSLVDTLKQVLADLQTQFKAWQTELTTKKIYTEQLCVGTATNSACLNTDQVKAILNNLPSPTPSPLPSLTPTPTPLPPSEATPSGEVVSPSVSPSSSASTI